MDLWKDIDALLAILYVCVFATVNLSHALPRGKRGVGGLEIQQRQEDLVLLETTGGLTTN